MHVNDLLSQLTWLFERKLTSFKKLQIWEYNQNLNLHDVARWIWYCLIHILLSCSTLHFQSTICILSNIVIAHFMNLAFLWFYVQSNYFQDLLDESCWHFLFLLLLQRYAVHDLTPNCTSKNPNLTIIFFHGIVYGIDDNWKQTWTTHPMDDKEECICWPEKWIPKDLNDNVKILLLSYDSNVGTSVHNDVTEIGRNLIQSLVIHSRYDNFFIYGHFVFHCVFQLKIIDCILTSLNKLFMWSIIVVHTKSWTLWNFQIHWR